MLEETIRLEELVEVLAPAAAAESGSADITGLLLDARADLAAMRAMQGRIDERDFGECEHCRQFIGVERLIALPDSTRCIACVGRVEP